MNKTLLVIALTAFVASAQATGFQLGGDTYNKGGNGGKGGSATSNSTGVGIGVGNAKASAGALAGAVAKANNTTSVGVGVKNHNSNIGVNKNTNLNSLGVSNRNSNVGINKQGQALHNTNLIGGSSQALENVNDLTNRNYMEGQRQGQDQAQKQGQGQGQSQSSKQANAQSMTYNESEGVHYSGEYTVRQAPGIVAPSIPPSAGCQKPITGGLSGTLGGVTFGTTYTDETCIMYEDIRFGLEGDATSRQLANRVIQNRLRGHLNDGVDSVEVSANTEEGSTESVAIFGMTDY